MKNTILFSVFLALISIQVNAQNYGLGNADPSLFTKYKIPDTDLHSLWFNTSLNFNSSKSSNYFQDYYISNYNNSSSNVDLSYSLSPKYYLLKKTDDKTFSLNCEVNGSYNYSRNITEGPGVSNQKEKNNTKYIALLSNIFFNKYINKSDLFYTFRSNLTVIMQEQQQDDPVNNSNNSYSNYKTQHYEISAGIGWGRMRDVTPVVSAIRFQERLKQVNALNQDLDEKTIEDLAQKFSQIQYYSDVYNRADKFFWQDVEKTLSNDGVSLNGLNQYSDSYIREVLNEVRFVRSEGMEAYLYLQLNYDNQFQHKDQFYLIDNTYYQVNSGPFIFEELYTLVNGRLDYSHQLNLNSQLDFSMSLSGGPNIIQSRNLSENEKIKQAYFFNSRIGYDYELTDRIVAALSNTFSLSFRNADTQNKNLSNDLKFSLHYFIEDNLSLAASYIWDYADSKQYAWENEGNNHFISLGFTYYIDRGLIFN